MCEEEKESGWIRGAPERCLSRLSHMDDFKDHDVHDKVHGRVDPSVKNLGLHSPLMD